MKWSVGLMTGTVLDGNIDIALLRTDGEAITELGLWTLAEYAQETQALLSEALQWQFDGPEPAVFGRGSKSGYSWSRVDVAGSGDGTLSFSAWFKDGLQLEPG